MSKSLGNLVMVRELLDTCSPDGVRLYLAQHHYRQAWEHDTAMLQQAEQLAQTWRTAVLLPGGPQTAAALDAETARTAVATALDADLQTPRAVAVLSQLAHQSRAAAAECRKGPADSAAIRPDPGLTARRREGGRTRATGVGQASGAVALTQLHKGDAGRGQPAHIDSPTRWQPYRL